MGVRHPMRSAGRCRKASSWVRSVPSSSTRTPGSSFWSGPVTGYIPCRIAPPVERLSRRQAPSPGWRPSLGNPRLNVRPGRSDAPGGLVVVWSDSREQGGPGARRDPLDKRRVGVLCPTFADLEAVLDASPLERTRRPGCSGPWHGPTPSCAPAAGPSCSWWSEDAETLVLAASGSSASAPSAWRAPPASRPRDVRFPTGRVTGARPQAEHGATYRPLDDPVSTTDVLVVVIALTDQTRGLIDGERLKLLPAGAIVVNAARVGSSTRRFCWTASSRVLSVGRRSTSSLPSRCRWIRRFPAATACSCRRTSPAGRSSREPR